MKRLVCLLVFLVAASALAQSKPPAELKQLDPFVGKWSCKGTVYAGEWGPEHPTVFNIDTHWSLGGQWLYTDYAETKTAKNPHPMKGIGLWSYDTDAKKFVGGWVDNNGMYQTQESDGWKGDEIVFTGPTHNGGMTGMTGRDTFKGKGKTITHLFEIEMKGTWKKYESDSCTKM
jgi:hypothetical protein